MRAARRLLERDGATGLTIRAVARELGVRPNALYSHVDGADGLVDGLLDDLLADVAEPPAGRDPRARLVTVLTSTHDLLTAVPTAVPLYLARQGSRGENAVRLGRMMDECLTAMGVAPDDVPEARRVLIIHVIGSAVFGGPGGATGPIDAAGVRRHFDRSLGWLIDGIVGSGSAPTSR